MTVIAFASALQALFQFRSRTSKTFIRLWIRDSLYCRPIHCHFFGTQCT